MIPNPVYGESMQTVDSKADDTDGQLNAAAKGNCFRNINYFLFNLCSRIRNALTKLLS